jgi:signal transduction histidine kinase/DNA-binding response OmpR family regulator
MAIMLLFVILYSSFEAKNTTKRQIEHFENTTITMEHVTENYLEGEQRICDVWAKYINNNDMTIEDAISFIRTSHVLENTSAHIVYKDTFKGLSTRGKTTGSTEYNVSYERIELLNELDWIHDIGSSINISRAYTNPVNGEQSIAFCNYVDLNDSGNKRSAILLRVLPISELMGKWVFPQEEFQNAEFSIIDGDGDYIIKGHLYKNSSFFEFYKSYNKIDPQESSDFFNNITTSTGSFIMYNSRGEKCILAYTPFDATGDWTLLSLMPMKYLNVNTENWILISFISIGLLVLFIFDLLVMLHFNKRIQASAKEAESANKAKTDFLSAMSHDIRTPMNAIIGFTTIAQRNIEDKKAIEENLRKISLASNHLLTLINDILDISKVESGKLNLCPQDLSLVETVENLMNISQQMIREKNLDFRFRVSNIDKEIIYADKLRLNQIFINILSNAIKYTEANGSVFVDLIEENSIKPDHIKIIYRVADTGIGMSKEFIKTMYQPFSRQTDSRVNSIQGTGLGLAITKQMVDLMEGKIECESIEGKGTTFTVTIDLPISNLSHKNLKLDNINILVVDNDELSLESASITLKSLGLNVDTSNNGIDAISLIKKKHEENNDYDIAIIDYKLNDLNGIETIKRLKEDIDFKLPLLLISSYNFIDIENEAKDIKVNGFINKPLFKSTLYDKITEILGKKSEALEEKDDYSDLEGLKILVAEDYDINYEIISSLLSMYGIITERAENGRICLDKISNAKDFEYTLIFMDIQMPIMNGLDATRAIRALPNKNIASIPIIAMTADAFSENVTECLNAGMNGHIAKPVDINLVIKEIRRIKEESKK